jgi:hypothetical protein
MLRSPRFAGFSLRTLVNIRLKTSRVEASPFVRGSASRARRANFANFGVQYTAGAASFGRAAAPFGE